MKNFDYRLAVLILLTLILFVTAIFSVWRVYSTSAWQVESKAFVTEKLEGLRKSQEEILLQVKTNQEMMLKNQKDYYEKWIKAQEELMKKR